MQLLNMTNEPDVIYWRSRLLGKTFAEDEADRSSDHKDQTVAPSLLPGNCRIIKHGEPVTKDYHPDRLNIQLDENNNITSIDAF